MSETIHSIFCMINSLKRILYIILISHLNRPSVRCLCYDFSPKIPDVFFLSRDFFSIPGFPSTKFKLTPNIDTVETDHTRLFQENRWKRLELHLDETGIERQNLMLHEAIHLFEATGHRTANVTWSHTSIWSNWSQNSKCYMKPYIYLKQLVTEQQMLHEAIHLFEATGHRTANVIWSYTSIWCDWSQNSKCYMKLYIYLMRLVTEQQMLYEAIHLFDATGHRTANVIWSYTSIRSNWSQNSKCYMKLYIY